MKFVVIVTQWAGQIDHNVYGPFDHEREAFDWIRNNAPRNSERKVRPLLEAES